MPLVRRHYEDASFTFAFVHELSKATDQGKLDRESFVTAFKEIMKDIFHGLDLSGEPKEVYPDDLVHYPNLSGIAKPKMHKNVALSYEDLLTTHRLCLDLKIPLNYTMLMGIMLQESSNVGLQYFHTLLLPFLHGVVQQLKERNIELTRDDWRHAIIGILHLYVMRYVWNEPDKPIDWRKDRQGCGKSADCPELGAFLESPTEQIKQFKMIKERRLHLERRLPHTDEKTCDLTATTDRRGQPQTLVITKAHAKYKYDHREWSKRATQAKRKLREVASEEDLEIILGDKFDKIANLKMVLPHREEDEEETPRPSSGRRPSPGRPSSK